MSDFLNTVSSAFKALLNRGLLSIESSDCDARAFGNSVVVLVGRNTRIRMLGDRGEVVAQAASKLEPDNWFPLQRVIRAVNVSLPTEEGLLNPEEAAELVERSFSELEAGLGATQFDQTKAILSDLERFAIKRALHQDTRSQ